jgi:hypothetical protein
MMIKIEVWICGTIYFGDSQSTTGWMILTDDMTVWGIYSPDAPLQGLRINPRKYF